MIFKKTALYSEGCYNGYNWNNRIILEIPVNKVMRIVVIQLKLLFMDTVFAVWEILTIFTYSRSNISLFANELGESIIILHLYLARRPSAFTADICCVWFFERCSWMEILYFVLWNYHKKPLSKYQWRINEELNKIR